jgi:phosphoglycolate phosphatase-like HAD superfamily hydrolase
MKIYSVDEVRNLFLKFHESKGHTILPSYPLVPKEDPTVLFNTAGMQPFIPYLTGESKYPNGITRIANSQKCIRTDDINEVGDNRHCTFFEMLGNWSLNDYFKSEIIPWSLEFMCDWLKLDKNRIFATVYKGSPDRIVKEDIESIELWKKSFNQYNLANVSVGEEFDFKKLTHTNPNFYQPNFEKQKFILFDFDGVLADTKQAIVNIILDNQEKFSDQKLTRKSCIKLLDEYFSKPKDFMKPSIMKFGLEIFKNKLNSGEIKPKINQALIEVLKTLKNTKIAIVSDNLPEILELYLNHFGIKNIFEEVIGRDEASSKSERLLNLIQKWAVNPEDIYYITDTVRDKLDLIHLLNENKILALLGGYCTDKTIKSHFQYHQILQSPTDLLNIFKPKLEEISILKDIDFVPRIRKMSGKDNWWGLPYRGPCGPCSEMYYLVADNDVNFKETVFPYCTLEQIENFIENEIVEIGNNVFMMYKGEKDDNKEPMNLEILGENNVDTGLGLERFVMNINSQSSVYEIDIYEKTLEVIENYKP